MDESSATGADIHDQRIVGRRVETKWCRRFGFVNLPAVGFVTFFIFKEPNIDDLIWILGEVPLLNSIHGPTDRFL